MRIPFRPKRKAGEDVRGPSASDSNSSPSAFGVAPAIIPGALSSHPSNHPSASPFGPRTLSILGSLPSTAFATQSISGAPTPATFAPQSSTVLASSLTTILAAQPSRAFSATRSNAFGARRSNITPSAQFHADVATMIAEAARFDTGAPRGARMNGNQAQLPIDKQRDLVQVFWMQPVHKKPLVVLAMSRNEIRGDRIDNLRQMVSHFNPTEVKADVTAYYILFYKSASSEQLAQHCSNFLNGKTFYGAKLYPRVIRHDMHKTSIAKSSLNKKQETYIRPSTHQVFSESIRDTLDTATYIFLPNELLRPEIEIVDRISQTITSDVRNVRAVQADPSGYYIIFGGIDKERTSTMSPPKSVGVDSLVKPMAQWVGVHPTPDL
ncbi:hypothetical protein B0J14DRAFT_570004 [Halenospora varia]|nr:hypothetical protein B0J14DRAFT_570004 [Halenospora varia]